MVRHEFRPVENVDDVPNGRCNRKVVAAHEMNVNNVWAASPECVNGYKALNGKRSAKIQADRIGMSVR